MPIVDGQRVVGIVSRGDFQGLELDLLEGETNLWNASAEVRLRGPGHPARR
jgi:hypothetical protein